MNAHPRALRLDVLAAFDAGETAESVSERFGVSVSNIRNWRALRDKTGDVVPLPRGGGKPRALDEEASELLVYLRGRYPDETHHALAARLAVAGIVVSVPTVRRCLAEAGFVRHAVKESAKPALSASSKARGPRRYRRADSPPDQPHRRAYPSDLGDAEWTLLEPLLPAAKPGGRQEVHPRREIVNALFYVLRSGCQWRMLPHDFPPWETVYDDFRRWRNDGVWEEINHILREKLRHRSGREKTPTAVIIDSQSVKTTERGGPTATTERNA